MIFSSKIQRMETAKSLRFDGSIPDVYDAEFGQIIFTPHAEVMIEAFKTISPQPEEILELACGSGRLTIELLKVLSDGATLTATDLSPDMIEIGKMKINAPESSNLSWSSADMMALPFQDAKFDCIIVQFGLMLAPNIPLAFSECKRVLKPGGTLLFNTWSDRSNCELFSTAAKGLSEALGPEAAVKANAISSLGHSLDDPNKTQQLLSEAGFTSFRYSISPLTIRGCSSKLARGYLMGTPYKYLVPPHKVDEVNATLLTTFKAADPIKANAFIYLCVA